MAEQVIAPVVPSSARGPRERGPGRVRGGRLPLPELAAAVPVLVGVVYGMGRVDSSGRVTDRSVIAALGWRPGERVSVSVVGGAVLVRRDPVGLVSLAVKPYVALPAGARRRLGIAVGDRVLLAAAPGEDLLVVYPLPVIHGVLSAAFDRGEAW